MERSFTDLGNGFKVLKFKGEILNKYYFNLYYLDRIIAYCSSLSEVKFAMKEYTTKVW